MKNSPVFAETYAGYLTEIGKTDYLEKAEMLGAGRDGDSRVISLYDQICAISGEGIVSDLSWGTGCFWSAG